MKTSPPSISKQVKVSEQENKLLKNSEEDEDYQPQNTAGNLSTKYLDWTSAYYCMLLYVVPVVDSESDANCTEEDESEDETFTVTKKKNVKTVGQKAEKRTPQTAKQKKEKKEKTPAKASKVKNSGSFS